MLRDTDIDFGHFLGNFKSKYGLQRETAPFVFTPAQARVLGGVDSPLYKQFVELCCRAYNSVRRARTYIITLFRLMLSTGIPELQREADCAQAHAPTHAIHTVACDVLHIDIDYSHI